MILVYLAGKYTVGDRDENLNIAQEMAVHLWDLGYAVLSPHCNSARFEDQCRVATYEDFLAGDLRMLTGCDVLFLLSGWQESPGAKVEVLMARAMGLPVVESVEELQALCPDIHSIVEIAV